MVINARRLACLLTASALSSLIAADAADAADASATRSFAVAWVYYASASQDGDCPNGLNPNSEGLFRRILKERHTPAAEIEKLMTTFPDSAMKANIANRGVIDGKPANAYVHPTSTKDPMLHLVQGTHGLGFNLDGKDGPNGFIDPETGEHGVDNQFFRAIGCSPQMRAEVGKISVFQAVQWDEIRDSQPAWLIQISGIDSTENDDDVEVRVILAHEPTPRDASGAAMADMTFRANPIPRTAGNVVHARIRGGVLTTEKFGFYMPGEAFAQADYAFKDARMRFTFKPDGSLKGLIGGYQDWRTIYASMALGGLAFETMVSYDIPGLYYALKKSADAYPDPKTGQNGYISSAYAIDAVPAFIAAAPQLEIAEKLNLADDTAQVATPEGITFKTVRIYQGVDAPGETTRQTHPRLFYANEADQPLYVYDRDAQGKSTCTGECAAIWPPALAPVDAKPMGDWSLLTRADRTRAQWAFRGRPLYTYAKDAPGNGEGSSVGGPGRGDGAALGHDADGVWHVIAVQPQELNLPAAITVAELPMASGQALATAESKTLYTFNGRADDLKAVGKQWRPLEAPLMARPIGDFSIIARADGSQQWAVRGKPLYTYNNDWLLGDANGIGSDPRFAVAMVMRYFIPANVTVGKDQRRGGVLMTADTRQPIYTRDRAYADGEGGHNTRGVRGAPATGKAIAATGCQGECEQTWRPLAAPANAQPSGYWSIVARADGSKQWAYQGYALYTYNEEMPGRITGHDIYNITVNDSHDAAAAPNLGMFWRVVSP